MRSTRFAAAFALVVGAGLAASAFGAPPNPNETPAEPVKAAPAQEAQPKRHAQPESNPENNARMENEAPEHAAPARSEFGHDADGPAPSFHNHLARFDRDNNGHLTLKERKAARQALRASRMSLMTAIDTDGDLSISDEEWAAFSATLGERDEDHFFRRREIFREFDANRNGGLDSKERKRANREMQDRRLDFVMQFDEDQDGALSDSEIAVANNFVERRREWFLTRWDSDNDGFLNESERRASVTAWASAAND